MKDKRLIVSVPNSGTRFLMARLGVEEYAHTHWGWKQLWAKVEGTEPIVALRHPNLVWSSWCNNNVVNNKLPISRFVLAWEQLQRLDDMMKLDIICVDKHQDVRITDRTPIGTGKTKFKVVSMDFQPLYSLPIVKRHYG